LPQTPGVAQHLAGSRKPGSPRRHGKMRCSTPTSETSVRSAIERHAGAKMMAARKEDERDISQYSQVDTSAMKSGRSPTSTVRVNLQATITQ